MHICRQSFLLNFQASVPNAEVISVLLAQTMTAVKKEQPDRSQDQDTTLGNLHRFAKPTVRSINLKD